MRSSSPAGGRALALAGMLAVLALGCTRAVRPTSPTDCGQTTGYDVIIVGAGMSGLTAERELRRDRPDLKVLILEATDRIGGRARTLKQGPPIDLGGAWLHGVATNPLTGIVDTLGFKRVTTHLERSFFTEEGRADDTKTREFWERNQTFEALLRLVARRHLSQNDCKAIQNEPAPKLTPPGPLKEEYLQHLQEFCLSLLHPPSVESAADLLGILEAEGFKKLLAANTGPLDSAREIEQTSTVDASEFEADDDALLTEGLGNFVETYGQQAPVCLNSPVTQITYRDEGVGVDVAGGRRFEARQALVTVSTGVLRAGKIKFEPQLPGEKQKALEQLPMGHMQKVIIDFKDQQGLLPEEDANSWVLYEDAQNSVMAFVIRPLNQNIAIGFYGGEEARLFEERCQAAAGGQSLPSERQPCDGLAVRRAQRALGKMYSPAVEQAVEKADVHVTRWSLEPWTLGAYSAVTLGAYVPRSAREELARPLPYRDGTGHALHQVFFAGEACSSPVYNGSLAGAYESGMKAARLMLGELPPRAP